MPIQPIQWVPFASDEERLTYLKEHKLTPKTYAAPKELFYAGIDAAEPVPCTAEGIVDSCTLVIKVGDSYHCIHPDYLLEMQAKKSGVRRQPAKRQVAVSAPKVPAVDFVAIDFETATRDFNSACSLGIALVQQMEIVETWYHLIQPPENRYEEGNVHVHGITPAQTADQPSLDQLWPEISRFFDGKLIIAHNARFDTSVLRESLTESAKISNFKYTDTLKMVKDVVPGRHGLDACCEYFNIRLEHHHNALDDAVACAKVAIACAQLEGTDSFAAYLKKRRIAATDFHKRTGSSFQRYAAKAVKISEVTATVEQFDLTHSLYQKTLVFTGDLSVDRAEAMQLAVNKGAVVKSGVSAKTNILVVGTQGRTPNDPMSSKERKARELIKAGKADIKIMEEEEFLTLVK